MKRYVRLIAGISLFLLLATISNTYARQLLESDGLRAVVDQNFFCAKNVSVVIDATDRAVFQGDLIKIQKLLGGTRATLGFECNNIKRINVVGKVRGESVYHAYIQEQNNWRLTTVEQRANEPTPVSINNAAQKQSHTVSERVPDSIDGFYLVSNAAIQIISAQRDSEGDYAYEATLFDGEKYMKGFRRGQVTQKGYWFPKQQVLVSRIPFSRIRGCDLSWSDNMHTKPLISVGNGVWDMRMDKNKRRVCIGQRVYTDTCEEVRCNVWNTDIKAQSDDVNVLVRDEAVARKIYSESNKREYRIH